MRLFHGCRCSIIGLCVSDTDAQDVRLKLLLLCWFSAQFRVFPAASDVSNLPERLHHSLRWSISHSVNYLIIWRCSYGNRMIECNSCCCFHPQSCKWDKQERNCGPDLSLKQHLGVISALKSKSASFIPSFSVSELKSGLVSVKNDPAGKWRHPDAERWAVGGAGPMPWNLDTWRAGPKRRSRPGWPARTTSCPCRPFRASLLRPVSPLRNQSVLVGMTIHYLLINQSIMHMGKRKVALQEPLMCTYSVNAALKQVNLNFWTWLSGCESLNEQAASKRSYSSRTLLSWQQIEM